MVAFEYDDGTVEPITGIFPPATALNGTSFNTGSTPDVMGLRFTAPFNARVIGARTHGDNDGAYGVKLVSTAYHQVNQTGILAQAQMAGDQPARGSGGFYRVLFTNTTTSCSAARTDSSSSRPAAPARSSTTSP